MILPYFWAIFIKFRFAQKSNYRRQKQILFGGFG
jgi:hypothetical protein